MLFSGAPTCPDYICQTFGVVGSLDSFELVPSDPPGVSGTTDDGGSLSTGALPSAADPLTSSVTTPVGGFVQLVEGPAAGPAPVGYGLFDQQVEVTAPVQTAETPLELTFQLDGSLLGGTPASAVKVWRNGSLVPNCVGGSGATVANPDPCVRQRASIAGGGARLTVLSSTASTWTFGKVTAVAPSAPTGVTATAGVRSAEVTWEAPDSDGGAPIGSYVVTATPTEVPDGVTAAVRSVTVSGTPAATSVNVTSLVNGVTYAFAVKAKNTVATAYGPVSAPSFTVTGLLAGLDYTFTMTATSTVGTSAMSEPFGPVQPTFEMSITNRSLVEGNSGQKSFTFTVRLTDAQLFPVTVDAATQDETADGGDYVPVSTTLTFDPGEKSKTVTVKVVGDTVFEPDEVFFVNLSNNSAGLVTIGQGSGIILNDDPAPG
jgi:hypothetical protein